MRLERLTIENFCQFRATTIEFQPGLNAIIGPNGSGKSNTLKAGFAAVTGDFSRNEGKQADNICDLAGDDEPSRVTLDFSHAGRAARVVRGLRPVGRSLVVDGRPPLTADKDVAAAVYAMLGVTPEILAEYVFVDQWEVFSVFSLTEAKRAAAFQRLFRIDKAQRVWDDLGKAVGKLRIPAVQTDKDELGRRRDEYAAEKDRLEEELARMPNSQALQESARVSREMVAAWDRMRVLEQSLAQRNALALRTGQDVLALDAQLAELRRDLQTLRDAEAQGDQTAAAARDAMARWREYHRNHHARVQLQQTDAELRAEWERKGTLPTPPVDYIPAGPERDALYRGNQLLAGRGQQLKHILDNFGDTSHPVDCPTCGTPGPAVAARVPRYQEEYQDILAVVERDTARLQRCEGYDRQVDAYRAWKAGYDQRTGQLQRQRAAFAEVAPPAFQEDGIRKTLADHEELRKETRTLADELARAEAQAAAARARADAEGREIAREGQELDALRNRFALWRVEPSAANAERWRREIGEAADAQRRLAETEGRVAALGRSIVDLDAEMLRLRRQQDEAVRLVAARDHLEDMRSVVHYSALPKLVSLHHLARLSDEVNTYLRLFEAPFRVEVDDKLTFTAVFHQGGRRRPAGRLSGGQKVVLALAFRLSVNNAFATDLGLLCLDEPTVGLDEANLSSLENALGRLRELARSTGLQVVMVTHEKSLAHMFDHVIDFYPKPAA